MSFSNSFIKDSIPKFGGCLCAHRAKTAHNEYFSLENLSDLGFMLMFLQPEPTNRVHLQAELQFSDQTSGVAATFRRC